MIEIARALMATQFTVAAVNAQITALNTRYSTSVPAAQQVVNMWGKSWIDMPKPSFGYYVGLLGPNTARLKTQGFNRMTVPVHVLYASAPTDIDTAQQQVAISLQAALYVLETIEGQSLPGVSPPAACVLIGDYQASPLGPGGENEAVNVDAAGTGKVLGFRLKMDFTLDDVRN